jgi:hypothetical protein
VLSELLQTSANWAKLLNKAQIMDANILIALLSSSRLLEEAGEKVFYRGKAYYDEGAVSVVYHAPLEAVAEVEGSQPYRVELKNQKGTLEADCTCPAMSEWGFCKHAVALGLYLIDHPKLTHTKVPPRKKEPNGVFEKKYPKLAAWIQGGWIEIGRDGVSTSLIRVMDEGGMVWEGGTRHKSIDKMLDEAEQAIKEYL